MADEDDFEEIPDEEKLAIATHFLMSSPPGEIHEVLKDVKTCVNPPSLLTDQVLEDVFRNYNLENFEVVESDSGPLLLSEATELEKGVHVQTETWKTFKVNHFEQTAKSNGTVADVAKKSECEAIYKAIRAYVDTQYAGGVSGNTACAVVASKKSPDVIFVQISGQKTSLRSFWSGKWRSHWSVNLKTKKIEGLVRTLIHYFEDANVQMETKKDVSAEPFTPGSTNDSLAKAVKTFVEKQEQMVQDTLEEIYTNMSQESFKDMRRVLPITKSKMDWTGAQARLASYAGTKKG